MRGKFLSVFCAFFLCSGACLFSQGAPNDGSLRSITEIFPGLDAEIKEQALSPKGYIISHRDKSRTMEAPSVDPYLQSRLNALNPTVTVEALLVIPYPSGAMNIVDVYNGIRQIRDLSGRLYYSATRDATIPLFEEATRLESAKRTSVKEDPPPRPTLPDSETIYIRLKDANFGNSYYQANIKKSGPGFIYDLFNNRDLTYFIIPAIKAGCFAAQFYLEPVSEGVLVYSISGAEVSNFIASKIHIPSAIQKRLEVLLEWVADGISGYR
jgi:hypothetical protein